MHKLYSAKAHFENFKQRIKIDAEKEWDLGNEIFFDKIKSIEDYKSFKEKLNIKIPHCKLLDDFYKESENILVLGAGDGTKDVEFVKNYRDKNIILSDISPQILEFIAPFYKFKARKVDIRNIDFARDNFDFVYAQAIDSFFNDKEYKRVVSEMSRVVKPGHCFILTTVCLEKPGTDILKNALKKIFSFIPVIWITIYKIIKKQDIKWTGYMRSLNEHFKIFSAVGGIMLEKIDFDYKADNSLYSVAFIFRKVKDL